ncbi:MAG: copper chaperone PCu(A)C [Caulobacteraceae bacterium]
MSLIAVLSRRAMLAASLAVVLACATEVQAATNSLVIAGAWTRPAAVGVNGAGYLSITNKGRTAERLTGASSAAAARVSIHESRMVGQVMTMRALGEVAIPPGATVTFKPGGRHLMLEALKAPLKAGDQIALTLVFATAGRRSVLLAVRDGPPAPAMADMKM